MKNAELLILVALLASCVDGPHESPSIPANRPPTFDELVEGDPLILAFSYPAPTTVGWEEWVGEVAIDFLEPTVATEDPPATVTFSTGFSGSCLSSMEGTWVYDEATGDLSVLVVDSESALDLSGSLMTSFSYDDPRGEGWATGIVATVNGSGIWDVIPGAGCAGQLSGGNLGVWVAGDLAYQALESVEPGEGDAYPLLRVLVLDAETLEEVALVEVGR